MKLLITGGAGFIGANFVHYWLKKYPKDEVRVIDSLTYAGNIENLATVIKKIKFVEADINDRAKVAEAMRGIDTVVNFAAESHVDRSVFDPTRYWQTNVHGTVTLLQEAHKLGISRFHHISTDEVYGELPLLSDEKFSEKTPYSPLPDNLYALSKAEADKMVLNFAKETEMHITISNCSNNYGLYQFPEKFVPIVIANLIDGIQIPIHGDGRNVRDWIHTKDHSHAIDLILEKGKRSETYLVGSNNARDNNYIAEKIVSLCGENLNIIRHVPDRHSNDRRYAINASKIVTELGWKPEIGRNNFNDGLKETIDWYKENQDWWRPLLKRKANIVNGDKTFSAYIRLDRQTGKTKFLFGKFKSHPKNKKEDLILENNFVDENLVRYKFVMENLESKTWYKKSSLDIVNKIKDLSINLSTFGYVEDLSMRRDKIGEDKIVCLSKIEHADPKFGVYGIASWFEVENSKKKKRMEGYYSWGWGPKSGAKMLVLIRRNKDITHLAFRRTRKFPTGALEYDLVGGFPKLNESILDLIVRSIQDELKFVIKIGSLEISEIISLGRIMSDAGITNNHPNLYAIVLDVSKGKLPKIRNANKIDENDSVVLWPINDISEIVNKCDDSYFLAAVARLMVLFNKKLRIKKRI